MANKVLILTGAPDSSTLEWSSSELLSEFQDTIARFVCVNANNPRPLTPTASSASQHAAWRSLSLDRERLPTGFSQQHAFSFYYAPDGSPCGTSPEFLATASVSFVSDGGDGEAGGDNPALSQFYEYSLLAHEKLSSSQLVSQPGGHTISFLSDSTTSFLGDHGSQAESLKGPLLFRGSDVLSDLKNIPSAAYLVKIVPQTMTCNLIVGIISISSPRAVKTHWGATKHLVEVLVGDETRAGFAITYWLSSDSVAESPLAGLRRQDIVLVQNVALNVFAGKVYGSSLRKDLTKVHLLHRMKLDARDAGGYYNTADFSSAGSAHPQLEKARRVRDWVLNFVGNGNRDRATQPRPRWDRPPADDTQLA